MDAQCRTDVPTVRDLPAGVLSLERRVKEHGAAGSCDRPRTPLRPPPL
jgi:hypothetical protein